MWGFAVPLGCVAPLWPSCGDGQVRHCFVEGAQYGGMHRAPDLGLIMSCVSVVDIWHMPTQCSTALVGVCSCGVNPGVYSTVGGPTSALACNKGSVQATIHRSSTTGWLTCGAVLFLFIFVLYGGITTTVPMRLPLVSLLLCFFAWLQHC